MPESSDPQINKMLFGEVLVKRNKITAEQLAQALEIQQKDQRFLGEILVQLGFIDERDIVAALIVQYGFAYIAINKYAIDKKIVKLIPEDTARTYHLIALDKVGEILSVVMENPLDLQIREKLGALTRCRIAPFISTKTEIDEAIKKWYSKS